MVKTEETENLKKYRPDELPTGREVNSIVSFYYELTTEQYRHIISMLDLTKEKRIITALVVTNAVIAGMLFWIMCHLK